LDSCPIAKPPLEVAEPDPALGDAEAEDDVEEPELGAGATPRKVDPSDKLRSCVRAPFEMSKANKEKSVVTKATADADELHAA
jgi:hypothetical protein